MKITVVISLFILFIYLTVKALCKAFKMGRIELQDELAAKGDAEYYLDDKEILRWRIKK